MTLVYIGQPRDSIGCLVGLEALILGALAGYYLGETVHPVFRISVGVAVLLIYPYLYVIPYVGVVLNAIFSLLYSGVAGALVYGWKQPKVDRIWIVSASIFVLILSFILFFLWHRKVVKVVKEQDPIRLLRFFAWIRRRSLSAIR